MNKKVTQKLLVGALICCNLFCSTAFATDVVENKNVVNVTTNEEGIAPYSMYYVSANIRMYRDLKTAEIYVNTEAVTKIDHIYQDITIYKNHNWVSSNRYHKYNTQELLTVLSVSAQAGDYIEVYVDNYTDHNGCVEVGHTSKAMTF